MKIEFSRQILEIYIPNFIKIRPVGVELFYTDRRSDMTKLIVAFRNSVNAPKVAAWYNSAPTGRIFMKFDILSFFENLSRKFKFR
jgi:hypothetical protein